LFYDVIVAGGGPAGSTLAPSLAGAGCGSVHRGRTGILRSQPLGGQSVFWADSFGDLLHRHRLKTEIFNYPRDPP